MAHFLEQRLRLKTKFTRAFIEHTSLIKNEFFPPDLLVLHHSITPVWN